MEQVVLRYGTRASERRKGGSPASGSSPPPRSHSRCGQSMNYNMRASRPLGWQECHRVAGSAGVNGIQAPHTTGNQANTGTQQRHKPSRTAALSSGSADELDTSGLDMYSNSQIVSLFSSTNLVLPKKIPPGTALLSSLSGGTERIRPSLHQK